MQMANGRSGLPPRGLGNHFLGVDIRNNLRHAASLQHVPYNFFASLYPQPTWMVGRLEGWVKIDWNRRRYENLDELLARVSIEILVAE